jgi:hypothetical protein
MTREVDMKRQWDGLEKTDAGKRVATILDDVDDGVRTFRGLIYALPIGAALWLGMFLFVWAVYAAVNVR